MNSTPELTELLEDRLTEEQIQKIPFEQGLKLLEELVSRVESGSLTLERSVSAYEKGVVLMNHLRSQITGAEKKLELLQKSQEKKV